MEGQLDELAIAEQVKSTRAVASKATWKPGRDNRDFFVLKTTVAAASRTLRRGAFDVSQFDEPRRVAGCSDYPSASRQGVVLALQRNVFGTRERLGTALPIVPFPHGALSLADLALDPTAHPEDVSDCFSFLIPRVTFEQLADDHGADRIVELALTPGVAANDPIVLHLGNSLKSALNRHEYANDQFVDRITTALSMHLARVYGGMHFPRPFKTGGLAPWQLRLARDTINTNLEGELSLKQIARECGLSISYFARAFTRSTGASPHRWLMRRRVDVAKNLMLTTDCSLVEISLRCGFSDQSHFSRVFAETTGKPPGRWRQIQLN
jgi:AraC family transcriptional regulator